MHPDGGVGGGPGIPASIEETAVAVEALARVVMDPPPTIRPALRSRVADALNRGVGWLLAQTDGGRVFPPAPIGLYFAKLWYAESLYPLAFTVAALEQAAAAVVRDRR